jgi:hypothetical protein
MYFVERRKTNLTQAVHNLALSPAKNPSRRAQTLLTNDSRPPVADEFQMVAQDRLLQSGRSNA